MGEHWQNRANCVGVDPEIFFPTSRNDSAKDAKRICRNCPVQKECRQSARDNQEEFGVWGGRTEQERNGPRGRRGKNYSAAENVEFVLLDNPGLTSREVGERLGIGREAVRQCLLRAGRDDLRAQLNRNAHAAGLSTASSTIDKETA